MPPSSPEPPNATQRELRLAIAALFVVVAVAGMWMALRYVTRPTALTYAKAPPPPGKLETIQPPADAALSLLPITREEIEPNESSTTRFLLHIPIKARPRTPIHVKDLVIHVLFYDVVDRLQVVQTAANVKSRWDTPPADWFDSDTETLTVEYDLPKSRTTDANGKPKDRKYYGYLVRLYYQKQFQAAAGEPQRLLQQYPPKPTLPE